jgi:hypothetical protein
VNSSGQLTTQGLVARSGPATKAFGQAHASAMAWARPRAVAAHRVPTVVRPVQLVGGLPGAKVDGEIVLEEGDTRWARGGKRGLSDGVWLWWGGNVGGTAELSRRRRAPVAGGRTCSMGRRRRK